MEFNNYINRITNANRIVVKMGSEVLADKNIYGKTCISSEKITDISKQIVRLNVKYNKEIILVSSAGMLTGKSFFDQKLIEAYLKKNHEFPIEFNQVFSGMGQPILCSMYKEAIQKHSENTMDVSQLLLTKNDFIKNGKKYPVDENLSFGNRLFQELRQSILDNYQNDPQLESIVNFTTAINCGFNDFPNHFNKTIIHEINENDNIATNEIKFGDNDYLSAMVAVYSNSDALIKLTAGDGVLNKSDNGFNYDGNFYKKDALIGVIDNTTYFKGKLENSFNQKTKNGSGGMLSTFNSSELLNLDEKVIRDGKEYHINIHIPYFVINGTVDNCILKAMSGEMQGTVFPNENVYSKK